MTARTLPWHGVLVATALPLRETQPGTLAVDLDGYADHVAWSPRRAATESPRTDPSANTRRSSQRSARVVTTAVTTGPEGFTVMPGGAAEARRPAEQAAPGGDAVASQRLPGRRARDADSRRVDLVGDVPAGPTREAE